ncbi:hypothetical protein [Priestia megaterium]|uniref:hypothetical protein n=1 Tax=Priestia megaterium TaxID=1404 RepID=UPI002E1E537B|nr:hypothetical protein [Priestia megaterium]
MKKHDINIQGVIKEIKEMADKSIPGMGGHQAKLTYMKHLTDILSGLNKGDAIIIDPKGKGHLVEVGNKMVYVGGALHRGDMLPEGYVVISPDWLRENDCLGENLSLDVNRVNEVLDGRPYVFDEAALSDPSEDDLKILEQVIMKSRQIKIYRPGKGEDENENFVALDEAHVLAPFPFKLK